jgi:outer membrane protein assembly factor BamD
VSAIPHRPRARRTSIILALVALVLVPLVAGLSGCAGADRPIAAASPADQLRIARLRYDRGDYTEAIEMLNGYIQFRADAPDLDEAHFLLGMCHVQQKAWPLAAGEFIVVTSDHPDSPRLADAHYWLGVSYWRQARPALYDQDPTRRALAQWSRFLQLYPNHPRADEARAMQQEGRDRLAEKAIKNGRLYLTLKQWSPALYYFEDVLREYPESKWSDWARVGRGEALGGLRRRDEAVAELESVRDGTRDPEVRRRAEEKLKKLPPPVEKPHPEPMQEPKPATADSDSGTAG